MPPHAWKHTEEAIKKMYGVDRIEDVFEVCDQKPIGSGSIAQVYKAKFVGADGWYAVKVRHPGVEKQLLTDFALLKWFGDIIDSVESLRWMGLKESLVQFEHTLGVQVRLDFEAANLDLFNANFKACPHVTTSFPSPKLRCDKWGRHVSEDVLVESFEEGHSVAAYCAAAAAESVAQVRHVFVLILCLRVCVCVREFVCHVRGFTYWACIHAYLCLASSAFSFFLCVCVGLRKCMLCSVAPNVVCVCTCTFVLLSQLLPFSSLSASLFVYS